MDGPRDSQYSFDGENSQLASSPPEMGPLSSHATAHISPLTGNSTLPLSGASNVVIHEPKPANHPHTDVLRVTSPITRPPTYASRLEADLSDTRIFPSTQGAQRRFSVVQDEPFDPSQLVTCRSQYPLQPAGSSGKTKHILYSDNARSGLGYISRDPRATYLQSDYIHGHPHRQSATTGASSLGHSSEYGYPLAIAMPDSNAPAFLQAHDKFMTETSLTGGDNKHYGHQYKDSSSSNDAHGVPPLTILRCSEQDTLDHVGYRLSRERMTALSEVDHAVFSWFHFKVCLIAGVGFFTDAYDIFAVNIASSMMRFVYDINGSNALEQAAVKAAAPIGTLIGQLLFGWLADRIGRKRMYGIELIIIIIGTFGQSLAANSDVHTVNIFSALIVWRIIMGLGVGGDYPLSAVISSEFAATHIRGQMLTAVFANQGWGQFFATVVAGVTVAGFRGSFSSESLSQNIYMDVNNTTAGLSPTGIAFRQDIDQSWRILIGLGCVPAAIALWFRLTIPETPRFTMDIERNVRQAIDDIDQFLKTGSYNYDPDSIVIRVLAPRASWKDFFAYFGRWENYSVLAACAYTWFAIDVVFYGLGLNTDKFFSAIGFSSHLDQSAQSADHVVGMIFKDFMNLIIANMFLSAVGLIPGYWVTFLLIEKLGRNKIQMIGFAMLTVLFITMGATFSTLTIQLSSDGSNSLFGIPSGAKVFLFLFILASFFQNFGPNTTTFIIPAENFPTRYRSTCHGICAASGKIGAIMSQFAFQNVSPMKVLLAYVPFTITGLAATFIIPETAQETLENLSGEESSSFIQGPVRPDPATAGYIQTAMQFPA